MGGAGGSPQRDTHTRTGVSVSPRTQSNSAPGPSGHTHVPSTDRASLHHQLAHRLRVSSFCYTLKANDDRARAKAWMGATGWMKSSAYWPLLILPNCMMASSGLPVWYPSPRSWDRKRMKFLDDEARMRLRWNFITKHWWAEFHWGIWLAMWICPGLAAPLPLLVVVAPATPCSPEQRDAGCGWRCRWRWGVAGRRRAWTRGRTETAGEETGNRRARASGWG